MSNVTNEMKPYLDCVASVISNCWRQANPEPGSADELALEGAIYRFVPGRPEAGSLRTPQQPSQGRHVGNHAARHRAPERSLKMEETTIEQQELNGTFAADDLADVLTGPSVEPPRVLIHGAEKIGKSTFGASAPKPIFIPTEDGLANIGAPRFPLVRSWPIFVSRIDQVLRQKHSYSSLVLDSLDWLERLIWAQVCADSGVTAIEKAEKGYGKGYVRAAEIWHWLLTERLNPIRLERGMAVILIAHSAIEKTEEPGLPTYDRAVPHIDKRARRIVCEWVDCIGFAKRKVRMEDDEASRNDRKIPHPIGNERTLVVADGKPECVSGNRYGITAELPLSWEAFSRAAFGGA